MFTGLKDVEAFNSNSNIHHITVAHMGFYNQEYRLTVQLNFTIKHIKIMIHHETKMPVEYIRIYCLLPGDSYWIEGIDFQQLSLFDLKSNQILFNYIYEYCPVIGPSIKNGANPQ